MGIYFPNCPYCSKRLFETVVDVWRKSTRKEKKVGVLIIDCPFCGEKIKSHRSGLFVEKVEPEESEE